MLSWSWCRTCWTCSKDKPSTQQPGRSSMHRILSTTLLCGLLAAQQAPKQAPPPASQDAAAQEQENLIIRVPVDYVSTPAWVYDRDGATISGVRPDAFRLFDN